MSRKTKSSRRAPSSPGSWTPQFSTDELTRLETPLPLICGECGVWGKYHVGTITIDPMIAKSSNPAAVEEAVGFTGYFRCWKCDAGGPWELPDATLAFVMWVSIEAMAGREDAPVIFGATATFDKQIMRYATDGETHIKGLIEAEPERAFLWVRLGNVYSHSDLHERAEAAYERAIELDPKDIEAHSMLGQSFFDTGRYLEAVPCYHAVLRHVRDAKHVDKELRRSLARGAIENLLAAHAESNGQSELLPKMNPDGLRKGPDGEPVVVEIREIDLGTEEGLEDLCDMYLGQRIGIGRDRRRRAQGRVLGESDDWLAPTIRRTEPAVGRNAPCPCGSRHKYKKCCGRTSAGRLPG